MGAGRSESATAYVYASDAVEVLRRYKTMPGVKRNPQRGHFPDITPIAEEEAVGLEKKIIEEKRVPIAEAKKTWYYPKLV